MRYYPGAVPWRFVPPVSAAILAAADSADPERFRREVNRRRQRDALRGKAREFKRQALRDRVAQARAVR